MLTSELPIPNQLLSSISRADYHQLRKHGETVEMKSGQILTDVNEDISHVYFINDCVVSLLTVVDTATALGVALVGREGMVGVGCALGVAQANMRAVVQTPGTALRVEVGAFLDMFRKSASLRNQVLLYVNVLKTQIAQTAACNRFHVIEERLARWLLMTRDRLSSDHFYMTHEFLSYLLGVRRVGVTNAAQGLKQQGLIDYSRGAIDIIDGMGLERSCCSCYTTLHGRHGRSSPRK